MQKSIQQTTSRSANIDYIELCFAARHIRHFEMAVTSLVCQKGTLLLTEDINIAMY
jgi:hypothetical protein